MHCPKAAEPNSTTPIEPLPSRSDWGFRASRQLAAQLAYFRLDEWLLSAMSLVLHMHPRLKSLVQG